MIKDRLSKIKKKLLKKNFMNSLLLSETSVASTIKAKCFVEKYNVSQIN